MLKGLSECEKNARLSGPSRPPRPFGVQQLDLAANPARQSGNLIGCRESPNYQLGSLPAFTSSRSGPLIRSRQSARARHLATPWAHIIVGGITFVR